jgi:hypothetical protein
MKHWLLAAALLAAGLGRMGDAVAQPAVQEQVDLDMTARIRQEAFQRSQVMALLDHLTDVIGPRLTNSPAMAKANQWARERFSEWGLANVHDEAVEDLGRGWQFTLADVQMLSPRAMPLHALPKAWTPGTPGAIEGEAVQAKLESDADLAQWRGKLRGKIVFLDEARPYKPGDKPDFQRYSAAELEELLTFPMPRARTADPQALARMRERLVMAPRINQFLSDEGVLATVSISRWDDGIVRVMGGGSRKAGEAVGVPALVMAAEHYNTVVRALQRKEPVRLRLDVDSRFLDDSNQPGYNTIAELPGSGPHRNEVVMLGAHLDSWHAGAGANDNGAGVAVMMEAMRILKAVGARPDRTIRVALWTGEEQGLLGSQAYVARHFARFEEPDDPQQRALPPFMRQQRGKLIKLPEYDKISVYFNLDNGSGRIRGIYAQENLAAAPIFAEWLKPWHDVGATIVTQRNTGSTDHVSFDAVGIPGFQFVQDQLDYFSHVHHTELDVQDHAVADDLKQAAAIVAAFAYHAAMRPQPIPRKPMPDAR